MKKSLNFLDWFLVVFWIGLIFIFSDQPNLKSSFDPPVDFFLRKWAHFFEYSVLTLLLHNAFSKIKTSKPFLITGIIAILYAMSDEWHQTFVFGREGTVLDVIIDSVAILVTLFFINIWKRKKQ